jgi:hypothetical protein
MRTLSRLLPAVDERDRVECTILLEEASVLACAGRLEEAVDHQRSTLLLADKLADSTEGGAEMISEADITARMLELVRLYKWTGRGPEADELLQNAVARGEVDLRL